MTRPLVVLRPEPGNTATARRIEARGYAAIRLPLFAVRSLAWEAPDSGRFDALLVTSANVFRHGGPGLERLRGLPVHAVGAATATAARGAGFTVAAEGVADAEAMIAGLSGHTVLHLAGREHRAIQGAATVIVYASDPLAPDLSLLVGGVALVHSPRAGSMLASMIDDRQPVALAAISRAARAAAGVGWGAVAVADVPTDAALIDAAIGLAGLTAGRSARIMQ